MVFIRVEQVDNVKARVKFRCDVPEQIPEEERGDGIMVDSIPEPQNLEGKVPTAYYMYATKEIVYEYVDRPKTTEEQLAESQEKIALMQKALDDLLLGGM